MHARGIALALAVIMGAGAAEAQPEPTDPVPAQPEPVDPAPTPAPVPVPVPVPTTPTPTPEPEPEGPTRFTWIPFGYLRIQAGIVQNDPNVAFVGRDDGFELQNARVGVRGDLETRASFVISLDGAVDERARINDPDGKLRVGLRDAFVDLHLGAGELDLRVGRFDPVFDPDRMVRDTERAFVDRALESRGTRPTEGWETDGLPPGRSIGLALRREPDPDKPVGVGVELAVQNGADEFSSDNDNDLPAVSVAAQLRFGGGKAIMLAAARWNPRTEGDLPFQQEETDLEGALGALISAGPVQIGAGAILVRTKYDTTGGPSQNAYGGHAQVMVGIGGSKLPLAIGYRFAILDPSDLILTNRVMEHTAGAVIAVPAWHLRGQLNVTHVMEQSDRALSNGRVEAALEVQL